MTIEIFLCVIAGLDIVENFRSNGQLRLDF